MKDETNTRRLKVYYAHYGNKKKQHPYIRLAGFYLSGFNFKIGDKVEVTIEQDHISITKIE